jgi:glycosyltransferase involved in cell wall biosynthesis
MTITSINNTTQISSPTISNNAQNAFPWVKSVLFVQNYQGTGGTENISKMLLERSKSHHSENIKYSNLTLLDITIKGNEKQFPIVNHITQLNSAGKQETTTEVINWSKNSNLKDIQLEPGIHIGKGKFGLDIENICLKSYFLNLGHKTIKTETDTNKQPNTNRLNGVLIKSEQGFEINPFALASMKSAIEDASPQVVYVAQDHAVTLVSEAVKELNSTRPPGEKIGIAYGIHREDLAIDGSNTNEKSDCVVRNMASSHDTIQVAIVCSRSAGQNYLDVGGNPKIMTEVENGTDCEKFAHSASARQQFREKNNIPHDAKIVTLAGRYSPEKDFATYIKIINETLKQPGSHNIHFVGCGAMVSKDNIRLQALIKNELDNQYDNIKNRIHLLGFQDMPTVMSATDVILSTSRTESWGLTLLEASAAGCIAVYPDLPGTRNAMGSLAETYDLSVKRHDSEKNDPLFPHTKSLSDESISMFVSKLSKALTLSEIPEAKEQHVKRARETDVSKMYNGYVAAFELAHQRANSNAE